MRSVANDASLAESFMLENEWPCLFAMTLRAILIEPGHGQPCRRLKYIRTMWVMALNTIHPVFQHRVMLWKIEFGMRLQMAVETGRRIFSRVDNEFATSSASRDV